MAERHHDVKAALNAAPPPAATGLTGPGAYAHWRASTLGRVTEALEQRLIVGDPKHKARNAFVWRTGFPALAETVIGPFKTEVSTQGPWRTLEAGEFAALGWVDRFNHRRLLEPIGYVPPADYEAQAFPQAAVESTILPSEIPGPIQVTLDLGGRRPSARLRPEAAGAEHGADDGAIGRFARGRSSRSAVLGSGRGVRRRRAPCERRCPSRLSWSPTSMACGTDSTVVAPGLQRLTLEPFKGR